MKKNKISYCKFFIKSLSTKKRNKKMLVDLNYCFSMAYSVEQVLSKFNLTTEEINFLKSLAFKKEGFYGLKILSLLPNEKQILNLAGLGLVLLKCGFKRKLALSDAGRFFLVQIAEVLFEEEN